jgi:hypothetical protein
LLFQIIPIEWFIKIYQIKLIDLLWFNLRNTYLIILNYCVQLRFYFQKFLYLPMILFIFASFVMLMSLVSRHCLNFMFILFILFLNLSVKSIFFHFPSVLLKIHLILLLLFLISFNSPIILHLFVFPFFYPLIFLNLFNLMKSIIS